MMEKLWGDNFFDPATKKWTKKATGAATCKRGFVQFVYEPIKTIIEAAMADNKKKLFDMCGRRHAARGCMPGAAGLVRTQPSAACIALGVRRRVSPVH